MEVSATIRKSGATELRERVASLDAMLVQLAAAELAVQSARTDLQKLADRGLAYARSYATDRIDKRGTPRSKLEASVPIVRKPRKTRDAVVASSPAQEPGAQLFHGRRGPRRNGLRGTAQHWRRDRLEMRRELEGDLARSAAQVERARALRREGDHVCGRCVARAV